MGVKEELRNFQSYSEELGLDLSGPGARFKWFLASILFGKRISAEIAKRTFEEFERRRIDTPEKVLEAGWDELVEVLDSGGYVRYDFSTATKLLEISEMLNEKYGSLEKLHEAAEDSRDLEKRLLGFKGIGPVTVNIFLRELRPVWEKADPKVSPLASKVAEKLGLKKDREVKSLESPLVRLHLEYCKANRCQKCPVSGSCSEFRANPF